jgi:hypothetical protein
VEEIVDEATEEASGRIARDEAESREAKSRESEGGFERLRMAVSRDGSGEREAFEWDSASTR